MEFEFDGYLKTLMERLLQEVEEMGRRQEALETLTQRIMAEQEELRRRQEAQSQEWAELRRRQEAQSQEWQEFGRRWGAYSAAWEARLDAQMQQLEGFAQQFTALLPPEE